MQGPTHLVSGILIQKAMKKIRPHFLKYLLIASLAIVSHGILDKLGRFTYHPPSPLVNDWFWVSYHLFIALLTIFIFVGYWKKYKFGLIFSVFPDFDWVIIYSLKFFSLKISFWQEPILHKFFCGFIDLLPPFRFLDTLPNLNLERKGAVLEFILFTILIISIYLIKERISLRTKKSGS